MLLESKNMHGDYDIRMLFQHFFCGLVSSYKNKKRIIKAIVKLKSSFELHFLFFVILVKIIEVYCCFNTQNNFV